MKQEGSMAWTIKLGDFVIKDVGTRALKKQAELPAP